MLNQIMMKKQALSQKMFRWAILLLITLLHVISIATVLNDQNDPIHVKMPRLRVSEYVVKEFKTSALDGWRQQMHYYIPQRKVRYL